MVLCVDEFGPLNLQPHSGSQWAERGGKHKPQAGTWGNDLTGRQGDPHLSPFHPTGSIAIGTGFRLVAAAWQRLCEAVQRDEPAATGPYAWVRHRGTTASSSS